MLQLGSQDFADVVDVRRFADEGGRDAIDAVMKRELGDVPNVLCVSGFGLSYALGESGESDDRSRDVHVLGLTDGGGVQSPAANRASDKRGAKTTRCRSPRPGRSGRHRTRRSAD